MADVLVRLELERPGARPQDLGRSPGPFQLYDEIVLAVTLAKERRTMSGLSYLNDFYVRVATYISEALPGSHHENPLEPLVVGHVQVVDFEVERHPAAERRHAADPDRSLQCRSRCTLTGNDRKCARLVRAAKIAFTVLIGHCDIFWKSVKVTDLSQFTMSWINSCYTKSIYLSQF